MTYHPLLAPHLKEETLNVNLANGTDDDPFVDLFVPEGSEAATTAQPDGAHKHDIAVMPSAAPITPAIPQPLKAEAWWQDPVVWLKLLTPLVVIVWGFYLGIYFANPSNVPDTLVPPGIRQEAQAAPQKTADTTQPVRQNPSTQRTADTPALDFNTNETEEPKATPSASSSTASSASASPQTSASSTPEEPAKTSPSPQQSAPTEEPSQAPSEAPVSPSADPSSAAPSTDGAEEQVSPGDPAATPSE